VKGEDILRVSVPGTKTMENHRKSWEILEFLESRNRPSIATTSYFQTVYTHTAHLTLNQRVVGSSPTGGILSLGGERT